METENIVLYHNYTHTYDEYVKTWKNFLSRNNKIRRILIISKMRDIEKLNHVVSTNI